MRCGIGAYWCVKCQTGDNSWPEGGCRVRPVLNKLDESIGGKDSTHASFFSHSGCHRSVKRDTKDTPVTTKHHLGFPRTTTVPICNFLLDDELRQPFRECLDSSGLQKNIDVGGFSSDCLR